MARIPAMALINIGLIAGIAIGYYTGLSSPLWVTACLVCALFGFWFIPKNSGGKRELVFTPFVVLVFTLLGTTLAFQSNPANDRHNFYAQLGQNSIIYLKISYLPEEKEKTIAARVRILQVDNKTVRGDALVYFEKSDEAKALAYGDVIVVRCDFDTVRNYGNPHEFDYANYLRTKGIHHRAFIRENQWLKTGSDPGFFKNSMLSFRRYFESRLDGSGMKEENREVAKALILGSRNGLSEDIQNSFANTGVTHVLSVSGLHVGILMVLLVFLTQPLTRLPRGKFVQSLLVLLCIWIFAAISGLSPPVNRAATMFSFILVGKLIQRETVLYQSVLVSALLLILIDPLVIFDVGFQLSYAAVLGIIFIHPMLYARLSFSGWIPDKIWQITSVSLAAQLATLPAILFYFHQFPNYFLVANLIVIPLSFVVLAIGLAFLAFASVPFVGDFLAWFLDLVLSVMNWTIRKIDSIPGAVSDGFALDLGELWLLNCILFLAITGFAVRKKWMLRTSLAGLVILSVLQVYQSRIVADQSKMVIYNAGKNDVIDVFSGTRLTTISNPEFLNDAKQQKYVVMNNRFFCGTTSVPDEILHPESQNIPLQIGGFSLAFYSDSDFEPDSPNALPLADFAYLHKVNFVPDELVSLWKEAKTRVIIGSDVGYELRGFLANNLDEESLHDLKTEGALEIDL